MKSIDLSLEDILDYRWELKEVGEGKIKLFYNSMRGIPTKAEAEEAIRKVLEAKGLEEIYISGANGDVKVSKEQLGTSSTETTRTDPKEKRQEYDALSTCFGAEEDLLYKEWRGML